MSLAVAGAAGFSPQTGLAATATWLGTNRILGTSTYWANNTPPGVSDEAYFGTLELSGGAPQSLSFKGTGTTPTTINLSWGSAVFDASTITGTGTLFIDSSLSTTNTGAATLTLNGDGVATDDFLQLTSNVTGTVDFRGNGATSGSPLMISLGAGQIDVINPSATLEIEGEVIGSSGVTKVGPGMLYLYNGTGIADTYSGGLTINAGVAAFNNGNGLGNANNTTTINDGTLEFLPKTAASTGSLVPSRSIVLGSDSSTIDVTSNNTMIFNGAISGAGALNKTDTGTLIMNGNGAYSGATNLSAGMMLVNGSISTANSTVSASATLSVTGGTFLTGSVSSAGNTSVTAGRLAITGTGSQGASSFANLTISGSGVVDVGTSGFVIPYSGASPIGELAPNGQTQNYPAGSIHAYIQSAYDGGLWDNPGLTSSAAQNDPFGLTAVGALDQNDLLNATGSDYTGGTWMGISITSDNTVLVRDTYYGDADLDGSVGPSDVNNLELGFDGFGDGWVYGDFNYDGLVDGQDVNLLDLNYGNLPLGYVQALTSQQAAWLIANERGLTPAQLAAFEARVGVPEPTSIALLGVAGTGLLARRRKAAGKLAG